MFSLKGEVMIPQEPVALDVAVIGGGPAGISACIELSKKLPNSRVALFESEEVLGGIPRTCHQLFFGMRDLKWIYTGPSYARRLSALVRKTPVEIHTQATVLNIVPGSIGQRHTINVVSPAGLATYRCQFVVLATGCCEGPLGERLIPSARPSGIFTTWQIQQAIHLYHLKPGNHALVIGSEDVALSTVMSLKRAGVSIVGVVEESRELQTYPFLAKALSRFYKFPIFMETSVWSICGIDRVEGVELATPGAKDKLFLQCDTVVISGRFRPISQLIENIPIARDPATSGPLVDTNLMTSIPNIFSAGNVLRGGDMHDLCALEGRLAAQAIVRRITFPETEENTWVSLRAEAPIRYVVPQKVAPSKLKSHVLPVLSPGVGIQIGSAVKDATLEAWSGGKKVWDHPYKRLIANHRIPIPVEKFKWEGVDPEKGVDLRLRASSLKS